MTWAEVPPVPGMATEKERQLIQIALRSGLLTQEQVDECLAEQERTQRPLALIFLRRNLFTDRDLEFLAEFEERRKAQSETALAREVEDLLFASTVVEKGILTAERILDVLHTAGDAQGLSLGQVLMRSKCITVSQFLETLKGTSQQSFHCNQCLKPYGRGEVRPGSSVRCGGCGTRLKVPTLDVYLGALARGSTVKRKRMARQPNLVLASSEDRPAYRPPAGVVPGTVFAGYRIVEEVARGGMGVVYKAIQVDLGRSVALKLIQGGREGDVLQVERFKQEARAISRLNHPNIISVYEVGERDGCHFFTMEFVKGTSLGDTIGGEGVPPDQAVRLMLEIAGAIAYAHEQGVIHRDIKPSNILVDDQGTPMITDFGLARTSDTKKRLTRTGSIIGTPFYLPPEQVLEGSEASGVLGDVYALGIVFYELLTGRLPFTGDTTMEVYHHILKDEPRPPRSLNCRVTPSMESCCLKAIEKDPPSRYQSVRQLVIDLERVAAGEALPAHRPRLARRVALAGQRWRAPLYAAAAVVLVAIGLLATRVLAGASLRPVPSSLVESTWFRIEKARLLLEAGQVERAAAAATAVLEDHAGERGALEVRAAAYLRARDHKRALADLEKLLAGRSGDRGLLADRARCLFALKWYRQAAGAAGRVIAANPLDLEMRKLRARSAWETGQLSECASDAEFILEREARNVEFLFQLAVCMYRLGKPARAVDPGRRLLAAQPDHHVMRKILTASLLALGKVKEAAVELDKLVAVVDKDYEVLIVLGDYHLSTGNPGKALLAYSEAYRRNPGNRVTVLKFAQTQYTLGNKKAAVEACRRALQLGAGREVLGLLAQSLLDLGRFGEALPVFERLVAEGNVRANLGKAICLRAAGKLNAAVEAIDAHLQAAGGDPRALFLRAGIYHRMGRFSRALADLDHCRRKGFDPVRVAIRTAEVLLSRQRPAAALSALDAALSRKPLDFQLLAARGELQLRMGRKNQARQDLEKASKLQPGNQAVLRLLAEARKP